MHGKGGREKEGGWVELHSQTKGRKKTSRLDPNSGGDGARKEEGDDFELFDKGGRKRRRLGTPSPMMAQKEGENQPSLAPREI